MKARASLTAVILVLVASCASPRAPVDPSWQNRLDPTELSAFGKSAQEQRGTSGVTGIETGVLKGNPSTAAVYSIVLRVPANTRIEAHTHPDDRVATVLSGTWQFGYGERFDEANLKSLPPGSFYSEPPDTPHFARTTDTPAVLLITGYGPTGTRYVDESKNK